MFGNRVFGKKNGSTPAGPALQSRAGATPAGAAVGHRIFDKSLFEGEVGAFLRKAGFDPDMMGNIVGAPQNVAALMADDYATLQQALAAANRAQPHAIGVRHLLPPPLWDGPFREFLVKQLDLVPYRPWNTIFLPQTEAGAKALGLPLVSMEGKAGGLAGDIAGLLAEVHRLFQGSTDGPSQAIDMVLAAVRGNQPYLFPADSSAFTDRVQKARANVRTLAVATSGLPVEAIVKSQKTFLAKPEAQLIA